MTTTAASPVQLMVYPDVVGDWQNVDRWPDTEAKNTVFEIFRRLATLDIVLLGAPQEPNARPYLRFSAEAQQVFDTWRTDLERRLRADDHPVIISHLAKYRSLMPSLALLFHVIDCIGQQTGGPVSEQAARRAAAWCTYLEAHARRVDQAATNASATAAAVLAAKLAAGELPSPFRVRTVRLKGWAGLTDSETIELGLDLLEELHWVRRVDVKASVKGGRPTTDYYVNPAVAASSPSPEGFVGFEGRSPGEYALARVRHVEEKDTSSSSSKNLHTPPLTHHQNLRNPEPEVERDGATPPSAPSGPTCAERARAVRERAQRAPRR